MLLSILLLKVNIRRSAGAPAVAAAAAAAGKARAAGAGDDEHVAAPTLAGRAGELSEPVCTSYYFSRCFCCRAAHPSQSLGRRPPSGALHGGLRARDTDPLSPTALSQASFPFMVLVFPAPAVYRAQQASQARGPTWRTPGRTGRRVSASLGRNKSNTGARPAPGRHIDTLEVLTKRLALAAGKTMQK
jgi:hypothetical protein